ncbi:hypothetical protein [Butyrivibrio sp. VCD2006]|uniref:hypothetical protein n=1 Tax=Butyrivibrio sp. VCD2006 TaxID=1280664 RepID=UPI0003F85F19|nr:hypothetical protein [Butyrivibrio sp. VCD2006]
MNYNTIKDVLFKSGTQGEALIYAMHCTNTYKFIKDELAYYERSRNLLRDELLNVYRFLENLDMFEAYLDNKDI